MAIKINFDVANIPEKPTFILANKSGNKIGKINAQNIVLDESLNDAGEITFKVYKYLNGKKDILWDKIKDFKLLYCKENDMWYEITVNIDETNETVKSVSCTQLGQAELSQINLYDFEANTEDDIARDDYEPTVLYNPENENASLLHRMFKDKAKHYNITHVDDSIKNIQRTFDWDETSIYDACNKIAEEIKCLFRFNVGLDNKGDINRTVAVYDLESNCLDCGYRGEFTNTCPKCDSHNIDEGYGEDTTIFITADDLSDDIQYNTDTGSVKNCFKLEAGDDLMTATIRNCNPNGSNYIWYISDDTKEDMSDELVNKLDEYDRLYSYYQKEYSITLSGSQLSQYNNLINKYKKFNANLETIKNPIVGYSELISALYKIIDTDIYLQSEMLPTVEISSTNATQQAGLLTSSNLSPVSVSDIKNISHSTADNAVLSVAKCIVNANYQVKVNTSSFENLVWTGNFEVTNYSDEDDTAISNEVSITIDDDYEKFVNQKIQKVLSQDKGETTGIADLFKKPIYIDGTNNYTDTFNYELTKYCLDSLNSFYDICQSCIDILVEQGIADKTSWDGETPNLYDDLYYPYRKKLEAIQSEQKIREEELAVVRGKYNSDGILFYPSVQTILLNHRNTIQSSLNLEKFLGTDLWLEFCAYRRDDKYSNSNFISDGLNNNDLFNKANEFIELATKELKKSAELQHSISAKLHNLLTISKFRVLVDKFAVGNWLRIQIDDKVYKLRLLHYQINYDELNDIEVDFSDVMKIADGISDQQSIIEQAKNMASSYGYVQYQANQGIESKVLLDNWLQKGLSVTNMKIVSNSDNQNITWDNHGLLCREYSPITENYSDKQLKIINKGLYLTDDNWETAKTGIGNFSYYDPKDGQYKESYGVIADTIIGNLILSEKVGIYNTKNSITLDESGFIVTNGDKTFSVNPNNNEKFFELKNSFGDGVVIDENGNVNISGSVTAKKGVIGGWEINENGKYLKGVSNDSPYWVKPTRIKVRGRFSDYLDRFGFTCHNSNVHPDFYYYVQKVSYGISQFYMINEEIANATGASVVGGVESYCPIRFLNTATVTDSKGITTKALVCYIPLEDKYYYVATSKHNVQGFTYPKGSLYAELSNAEISELYTYNDSLLTTDDYYFPNYNYANTDNGRDVYVNINGVKYTDLLLSYDIHSSSETRYTYINPRYTYNNSSPVIAVGVPENNGIPTYNQSNILLCSDGSVKCDNINTNNITVGNIYGKNDTLFLGGNNIRLYSTSGGGVWLGESGSTAVTSDQRLKILYDIDARYEKFFNELKPILYQYKSGHRKHIGFSAQQIESALNNSEIPTDDFAGLVIDKDIEGLKDNMLFDVSGMSEVYNLRYEEFTALNTYMIQKVYELITELKQEIQELKQ